MENNKKNTETKTDIETFNTAILKLKRDRLCLFLLLHEAQVELDHIKRESEMERHDTMLLHDLEQYELQRQHNFELEHKKYYHARRERDILDEAEKAQKKAKLEHQREIQRINFVHDKRHRELMDEADRTIENIKLQQQKDEVERKRNVDSGVQQKLIKVNGIEKTVFFDFERERQNHLQDRREFEILIEAEEAQEKMIRKHQCNMKHLIEQRDSQEMAILINAEEAQKKYRAHVSDLRQEHKEEIERLKCFYHEREKQLLKKH